MMKNIVFGVLLFGCIYAVVLFVGRRRQARNDGRRDQPRFCGAIVGMNDDIGFKLIESFQVV